MTLCVAHNCGAIADAHTGCNAACQSQNAANFVSIFLSTHIRLSMRLGLCASMHTALPCMNQGFGCVGGSSSACTRRVKIDLTQESLFAKKDECTIFVAPGLRLLKGVRGNPNLINRTTSQLWPFALSLHFTGYRFAALSQEHTQCFHGATPHL